MKYNIREISFNSFEENIVLLGSGFNDKFSFETTWKFPIKYLNRLVNKLYEEHAGFDFYESLVQDCLEGETHYKCTLPSEFNLCIDNDWLSQQIPQRDYRLIA